MGKRKHVSDLSGIFGEIITVQKLGGRIVIKNRPKRKGVKMSKRQLEIKKDFQQGAKWAKGQSDNPESKALYERAIQKKMQTAYTMALRDFKIPPTVDEIDTEEYNGVIGDEILIEATDDFMVVKVKVIIKNASGKMIEQGLAEPDKIRPSRWRYNATVANPTPGGTKIHAIAFDRPGNKGTGEEIV